MTFLRRPPEQVAGVALIAYGSAIGMSIANIFCSYTYFRTVAPGGGLLSLIMAIGAAIIIAAIESGVTAILLSADEVGHLFTVPRLSLPPGFPAWIPKGIKFATLTGLGVLVCWTYHVDWSSTAAVLQTTGGAGSYLVALSVFGSEVLFIIGHALWGISKVSKVNMAGVWESLKGKAKQFNAPNVGGRASTMPNPNVVPMPGGGLREEAQQARGK